MKKVIIFAVLLAILFLAGTISGLVFGDEGVNVYRIPSDNVTGSEYIHDAVIDDTADSAIRMVIMSPTAEEHQALVSVALDWRSATDAEVELLASLPPPGEPPRSTHISILTDIDPSKARPAEIKREWEGDDYYYRCFVTQTVRDEYIAGKIEIGDYVLVHFDDVGEQVVTAKIFKSW